MLVIDADLRRPTVNVRFGLGRQTGLSSVLSGKSTLKESIIEWPKMPAAARAGGTAPAVLNAANEVAVQAFLDRRLNFTGIAAVIDKVLQRLDSTPVKALGDVLDADAAARRMADSLIELGTGAFA